MGLLDKFKKKAPVPEQQIDLTITTTQKGKNVKTEHMSNRAQQPVLKPNVFTDEAELEAALRSGNGSKKFQERVPRKGIETRVHERYDSDKLNAMLAMDVTDDKRQVFTVTPKEQFMVMVIGDTFDEVMSEGEEREESIWSKFSKHRDLRAPSTFPEPGDNRNALIKAQEIMSQENESGATTKWGGA